MVSLGKFIKTQNSNRYNKWLMMVNNLLYSGDLYINSFGIKKYISYLEFNIKEDNLLSDIQKDYLLGKLNSKPLTSYYLQMGYRNIWNLNNNIRDSEVYMATMYYIKFMEWGNKKVNLLKKMFIFVKQDNIISDNLKKMIFCKIYYEIQKQAEIEKHNNRHILYQINKDEDIHDLLEAFLLC